MGIPRLTQDLTPYLQPAVLDPRAGGDHKIKIQKLVIDGPSLVYHVYNCLAKSASAVISDRPPGQIPTYTELNFAVGIFLSNLISHGTEIHRIVFDGALPEWKRKTRAERLEKSRLQLECLKRSGWVPQSSPPLLNLTPEQVLSILWDAPMNAFTPSVTAPFIVPAVIDYLKASTWKTSVCIVPGEAEVYCASIARQYEGAVLTNDSDLAILSDMQYGASVLLLRSLSMPKNQDELSHPAVEGQCWRPNLIAGRLGMKTLLYLGFQRAVDSTVSFSTVLQRTREQKENDLNISDGFSFFLDQYKANEKHGTEFDRDTLQDIQGMDPRMAELLCQLKESHTLREHELWVTLPMLLEDPERDASWAYGRHLRRLAYSLLVNTYAPLCRSAQTVTEVTKRGCRIVEDKHHLMCPTKPCREVLECTESLRSLQQQLDSAAYVNHPRIVGYMSWALTSIVNQQRLAGKHNISMQVIQHFFGSSDVSAQASRTSGQRKALVNDVEWKIFHLNANLQALLYSLRMLQQAHLYIQCRSSSCCSKMDLISLLDSLKPFPTVEESFLSLPEVRDLMQQVSPSAKEQIVVEILRIEGRPSTESSHATSTEATKRHYSEVKEKRKQSSRKAMKNEVSGFDKTAKTSINRNLPSVASLNPYDLLQKSD